MTNEESSAQLNQVIANKPSTILQVIATTQSSPSTAHTNHEEKDDNVCLFLSMTLKSE